MVFFFLFDLVFVFYKVKNTKTKIKRKKKKEKQQNKKETTLKTGSKKESLDGEKRKSRENCLKKVSYVLYLGLGSKGVCFCF